MSKAVVDAILGHAPDLVGLARSVDSSLRSRAWDDAKITAHHAIIPTTNTAACTLGPTERALYDLIARRFMCQFLPSHSFAATRVEVDAQGTRFVATGREVLAPGWRKAFSADPTEADEPQEAAPPPLQEAEAVMLEEVKSSAKETKPPKPFTDASLMQAMVNIASFVSDARVKKLLSEADGIGTPATRPSIVETLFDRGYVERKGRAIVSTAVGRALIASLPAIATAPDMTAEWEAAMREIAQGQLEIGAFLERITKELRQLVTAGKGSPFRPPAAATASRRDAERSKPRRAAHR